MAFNAGPHLSPSTSPSPSPLPPPTTPKSKFESLPTELRLQIYSLLLNGSPQTCLLERCEISHNYPIPTLYPAILAVNRFISAETYPILYGDNAFLFLGPTDITDQLAVRQQLLSRLAGLPKYQRPPLLPERSRQFIKHVIAAPFELARTDWIDRLLDLAPDTRIVEFDFWVTWWHLAPLLELRAPISVLNASIPAIKSSINTSTQTFRIGIRNEYDFDDARFYPWRRKRALTSVHLAVVDLKGLDQIQEKRRKVHKALQFIISRMSQSLPMPKALAPLEEALVRVEKRILLHKDYAGFWFPDELPLQPENRRWISVDTQSQAVNIGSEVKSITWRRSPSYHVENKALGSYSH